MIAPSQRPQFRLGTYNNGQPYVVPRGRYAPRGRVEDRLRPSHAVVDLDREQPTAGEFITKILREMKIRFYGQKSIKNYRTVLIGDNYDLHESRSEVDRGGTKSVGRACSSSSR